MDRSNARSTGAGRAPPNLNSAVRTDEDLEVRIWLRLLNCVTLIEKEIRARLRTTFGATIARFEVLAQLYRVDSGLAMKELSDRLMVSKGNVTGLIRRMEGAGLLARCRDPVDGRAQIIRLTPKGRRLFDTMRPLHNQWLREMLGQLDRREMKLLHELLKTLKVKLPIGWESGHSMASGKTVRTQSSF